MATLSNLLVYLYQIHFDTLGLIRPDVTRYDASQRKAMAKKKSNDAVDRRSGHLLRSRGMDADRRFQFCVLR